MSQSPTPQLAAQRATGTDALIFVAMLLVIGVAVWLVYEHVQNADAEDQLAAHLGALRSQR